MVSIWPVSAKRRLWFLPKSIFKLRSYTVLLNGMLLSILTAAQWDLCKSQARWIKAGKWRSGEATLLRCRLHFLICMNRWAAGKLCMGKESDIVVWKMHVLGQAGIAPALLLCLQHNGKWGYTALSKTQLHLVPCSETLAEPLSAWRWTSLLMLTAVSLHGQIMDCQLLLLFCSINNEL